MPTRERLLLAAVDVFVERGFSGAAITDIAARAGISGPAAYKHFSGKVELLIEAARHSLGAVSGMTDGARSPIGIVERWLAPDFVQTRRLQLELHLAAGRNDELMDLLGDWHAGRARAWQEATDDSAEQVKAFYLLLLGLAQLDVLDSIEADTEGVRAHVGRMVSALFDDPPTRS